MIKKLSLLLLCLNLTQLINADEKTSKINNDFFQSIWKQDIDKINEFMLTLENQYLFNGLTPLMVASGMGCLKSVQALLKVDTTIDRTSTYNPSCKDSPAVLAARKREPLPFAYKRTALHFAALNKKWEVYDYLVEQGADQYLTDQQGFSPLAIKKRFKES